LQDANGNPSPNKLVNLSQGNGASIISATTARTDAMGKVLFTAVSSKSEIVTYTAVDVSDRNLPVPGSASVNFTDASSFCAGRGTYYFGTAAPGYCVTTFASNFPNDCFAGIGPVCAFDANGSLLVGDISNSALYRFGQQGGIAGPATQVSVTGDQLGGLAFIADGRLYAALKAFPGSVVELNPSTGAVIRTAANYRDPIGLAVDPISGDLLPASTASTATEF
jgi:Bacterial Ig-like domain (group 1)